MNILLCLIWSITSIIPRARTEKLSVVPLANFAPALSIGGRSSSLSQPSFFNTSTCVYRGGEDRLACSGLGVRDTKSRVVGEFRKVLRLLADPPSSIQISDYRLVELPWIIDVQTSSVKQLTVVSCELRSVLPRSLQVLASGLTFLDLSDNVLESLPEAVADLRFLTSLDLSRNRIERIDTRLFENLTRLVNLNLADNRLYASAANFSLLPLVARLDHLSLAGNGLEDWPAALGENWTKLRSLDLSSNLIRLVPRHALISLPLLAELKLEENQIQTIVLQNLTASLRHLSLLGNPIQCDCKSAWILETLVEKTNVLLPPCRTPFSRRHTYLNQFTVKDLCGLEQQSSPEFYRVYQEDLVYFPKETFSTLAISAVNGAYNSLEVNFNIEVEFYYQEYDWALIYRSLGESRSSSQFRKTRYNLRDYASLHKDWTPGSQRLTASLPVSPGSQYYEICLGVVEGETTYYLYQDLCREVVHVGDLQRNNLDLKVTVKDQSFEVQWKNHHSVRLHVREFGTNNSAVYTVTESSRTGNWSYTSLRVPEGAGFVVCVQPIYSQVEAVEVDSEEECVEVRTDSTMFSAEEVAAASAVSTSTTVVILLIVCCCCPSCREAKQRKTWDINQNKREKKADVDEEGSRSKGRGKNYELESRSSSDLRETCWSCMNQGGSTSTERESHPANRDHHTGDLQRAPSCRLPEEEKTEYSKVCFNREPRRRLPETVTSVRSLSSKYSSDNTNSSKELLTNQSKTGEERRSTDIQYLTLDEAGHLVPDGKSADPPAEQSLRDCPRGRREKRRRRNGIYHTVSYRQFYKTALPIKHYTPFTTQLRRTNSLGPRVHYIPPPSFRAEDPRRRPYTNQVFYAAMKDAEFRDVPAGGTWRKGDQLKF